MSGSLVGRRPLEASAARDRRVGCSPRGMNGQPCASVFAAAAPTTTTVAAGYVLPDPLFSRPAHTGLGSPFFLPQQLPASIRRLAVGPMAVLFSRRTTLRPLEVLMDHLAALGRGELGHRVDPFLASYEDEAVGFDCLGVGAYGSAPVRARCSRSQDCSRSQGWRDWPDWWCGMMGRRQMPGGRLGCAGWWHLGSAFWWR